MENDENVVSKELISPEQLEKIHKALKGIVDTTEDRPIDKFEYVETFEPLNYKLIEVTEKLAEHVLSGKEFYLSGLPEDAMVLCTKDRTYNAKEVERSNSMLLTNLTAIPTDKGMNFREFKVCSVLMRNIELSEAPLYKPERFREILKSREVNIFDDESIFPEEKMMLNGVFSSLPLSEDQIRNLLDLYPVFEIDGSIYCLNTEGREELMKEFISFLDNCNYEQLRESDLTESPIFSSLGFRFPQQVVESIVQWMLRLFFDKNDDSTTFKLNHGKIAREISTHILRKHAAQQSIGIDEMEKHFYRIMPTSIKFDIKFLRGIAFIKKLGNGDLTLKYSNSEDMSLNEKERLNQLFKMSEVWILEDIEPYIMDFVESKNVYEYLSKRCRSGISNGKTLFYPP